MKERRRKSVVKDKYRLLLLCIVAATLIFSTVSFAEEAKLESDYVGSDKCKDCHEEEFLGWENTLHSKMVQEPSNNPMLVLGDFSAPEVKKYKDKYKIAFTIGSHWEQRYLTEIKGDYFALPISWSVVTRTWKVLSTSKRDRWKRKRNSYYSKCVGCHTTNYNPKDKSYSEHTIGCESCHGPGKKHIENDGDVFFIINPSTLSDTRRDMVCAQCHVRAEDKSKNYTFPIGYKPGENLADYLSLDSIYHEPDMTPEQVIVQEFNKWKKLREAPKSCDVCGIEKPSAIPVHLVNEAADSEEFCMSCHNFGEKIIGHTHHKEELKCDDCHKRINGGDDDKEERNIHSYDYYLIHKKGCYDPFIEKACLACHKDRTKDWASPLVIDWSTPTDFSVHDN